MAFIVFALLIIGIIFSWTVNSAIEAAKERAVQMIDEGRA